MPGLTGALPGGTILPRMPPCLPHSSPNSRWLLATVVLAVALFASMPASAQDPPPPPVDEYTENIPTSEGNKQTGKEGGKTSLPPSVATQVQAGGGQDAALLEEIATSARYGAPQNPELVGRNPERGESEGATSAPGVLSAAVETIGDGGEARLIGLFIVMSAILAAMLAVALRQHPRRSR
jgi:hypothetical protein